jgi:twinkle protein
MGNVVVRNQPCLNSSCGSHDARQVYDNGTSYCFSCEGYFNKEQTKAALTEEIVFEVKQPKKEIMKEESKTELQEIKEYPIRGFKNRAISKEVCEFFDVRVSFSTDGEIDTHYYPYEEGAYKVRKLPKDFKWIGKSKKLFGQDKFGPGGRKLVITEGEIDALSVAQAWKEKYNKIYPVVSIPSATMLKCLLENREWIRTFDEVVICFDEDEAGKKATEEAARIVGFDKARLTRLPHKDPNEVLLKSGVAALVNCIFDATAYVPSGIIGKDELWESLQNLTKVASVPYPDCLIGVNNKLRGMRSGEITLFISGTGSGKSTILREIMLHIIASTPDKIGIVSLEETPAETARKLAGMVLERNPAEEEIPLGELKQGFDRVFSEDRVVLLDHQASVNDTNIIDHLEYMCLVGCKYLFIDHITILVSEGIENLSGNEAQDKVMNDLLRLVKRYPVWIGLVSHLRKASGGSKSFEEGRLPSIDDIRGSGSIKQVSFDIISFARNLNAANDAERNFIKMRILKARHTGLTGLVPGTTYSQKTGRLSASELTDMEGVGEDFSEVY